MTDPLRKRLAWLAPPVVLALGVAVLLGLVKTRPRPQRAAPSVSSVLVEVVPVRAGEQAVKLRALGTVRPAQQVDIVPEVSGRVIWQSPELAPGGRLALGEPLLRVDPRDYELAVEEQRAAVDRAQVALQLEQGEREVAERAWKLLGDEASAAGNGRSLALREPQLKSARVAARAAESGLKRAELNLARTTLRTPFNAVVLDESVDVGQVVGPQSRLATLVGSDEAWVQVSVPVAALGRLRIPSHTDGSGSEARIWLQSQGRRSERRGRVVRLLGDVDPAGLMARLLVALDDPFGHKGPPHGETPGDMAVPLLVGSYVTVEIAAGVLENVVEVPRIAVHEGDKVYVATPSDTLDVRHVHVAWRRPDSVLVDSGLVSGDRVIVSRLPTAVPGMRLRPVPTPPDRDSDPTAARGVR